VLIRPGDAKQKAINSAEDYYSMPRKEREDSGEKGDGRGRGVGGDVWGGVGGGVWGGVSASLSLLLRSPLPSGNKFKTCLINLPKIMASKCKIHL
jgi:hypothetical protein